MEGGKFNASSGIVLRSLDVLLWCLLVLIWGRIRLILRGSKTVWNLECRQFRKVYVGYLLSLNGKYYYPDKFPLL